MFELFAFYAPRGWTLESLAALSASERAFLRAARETYYEEQVAMTQTAIAKAFNDKGARDG